MRQFEEAKGLNTCTYLSNRPPTPHLLQCQGSNDTNNYVYIQGQKFEQVVIILPVQREQSVTSTFNLSYEVPI